MRSERLKARKIRPRPAGPRQGCTAGPFGEYRRVMERILHVLTGPTAVGKSEWALRWAESRGAEIVSCDSLLFYRGMDIGTAKPSPAERARVPHHLVDLLEVTETWDVTRYVAAARAACEAIAARGRPVLVTGGSGFYLKAFFAPVADDVDVPVEVRAAVTARLERDGLPALVAELRRLNPAGLGALDTRNPRRVGRALERCLASGRTLAELAAAFARQPAPFPGWTTRLVQLDRPRAELETRIEARVQAMLAAGLVEEVRRLLAVGLKGNPSAARAIGYRETIAVLEGRLGAEALAAAMVKNTRALLRKQLTWFRTQLPPHPVLAAGGLTLDELFPQSPATDAHR
jgi:tRNA dimethylallyltransferase